MADPISPGRWKTIDFMLQHPGRFSKADIHAAAVELRAEINLLVRQTQRTLSNNTDHEGPPS